MSKRYLKSYTEDYQEARSYEKKGKYEEALKRYIQVVQRADMNYKKVKTQLEDAKNGVIELDNDEIEKLEKRLKKCLVFSSKAKVKMVEMHFDGKINNLDNKKARKLLEVANKQNNKKARELLAYVYANGIGGSKKEKEALDLFIKEYNDNNSNPMVYIELARLLPKSKENDKFRNNLLNSVTNVEKAQYKRRCLKDKLNSNTLGKIVNFVPNKISNVFEKYIKQMREETEELRLYKLYEKAKQYEKDWKYDEAKEIYRRLAGYDYKEAKIKYAKMAYRDEQNEVIKSGDLSKLKDTKSVREIYQEILDERNERLFNIRVEITKRKNKLNKLKKTEFDLDEYQKQQSRITKEIKSLEKEIKEINDDRMYNSAMLNLGIVLVDNPENENDLLDGILYLKNIAKNGEVLSFSPYELPDKPRIKSRNARIAIKKLGDLYKENKWKIDETNDIEARNLFLKFSSGNLSRWTTNIANSIKNNSKNKDKMDNEALTKLGEFDIYYWIGSISQGLNLNKLAKSMYKKMIEHGDYRATYSLGLMEMNGVVGKEDLNEAKKHFSQYIDYVSRIDTKNYFVLGRKNNSLYQIGQILENQDFQSSIEYYLASAKAGEKMAQIRLAQLNRQGKWFPKEDNLFEKRIVNDLKIKRAVGKIETRKEKKVVDFSLFKDTVKKSLVAFSASMAIALSTGMPVANVLSKYNLNKEDLRNYAVQDVEDTRNEVKQKENNIQQEEEKVEVESVHKDENKIIRNKDNKVVNIKDEKEKVEETTQETTVAIETNNVEQLKKSYKYEYEEENLFDYNEVEEYTEPVEDEEIQIEDEISQIEETTEAPIFEVPPAVEENTEPVVIEEPTEKEEIPVPVVVEEPAEKEEIPVPVVVEEPVEKEETPAPVVVEEAPEPAPVQEYVEEVAPVQEVEVVAPIEISVDNGVEAYSEDDSKINNDSVEEKTNNEEENNIDQNDLDEIER